MHFLRTVMGLLIIYLASMWRGIYKVDVRATGNDLEKSYVVGEDSLEFLCEEFVYVLQSDNWWCPDVKHYLYKVTMLNKGVVSEALYPQFTSWHMNTHQYSHHLAIRAHIQTYSNVE